MSADPPANILIVDDDPDVRAVLACGLAHHGFGTTVSPGGAAAVAAVWDHGCDLALVDVQMPESDGPATVALLRAAFPDLRYAYLTGGGDPEEASRLVRDGALAVVRKPIALGALVGVLRDLLAPDPVTV